MKLVVDTERSERGRQRRKSTAGRLLHCCCICGHVEVWGEGWSAYCSIKDMDDCVPYPKFCSPPCRARGGPRAQNVSGEMMLRARDAEFREPTIIYREMTDKEKYRAASVAQKRGRQKTSLS